MREVLWAVWICVPTPQVTVGCTKLREACYLLGHILQHVYVDPKFVAEEYLARCKRGAWKKENTLESLKCYNSERILEAKEMGKEEPSKVDLDVYVGDVVGDIDDED
jgi:hypothetical protein